MTNPGDTPSNPVADSRAPLAPKVKWAAIGSYVSGVVALALVNAFTANQNELLFASLPDPIETFILPFVPGVIALVSGYVAKHQWRSDDVTGTNRTG